MTRKEKTWKAILGVFIAALGPLSYGYCLGYTSSALLDLENDGLNSSVRFTENQGSLFSVSSFFFLVCCFPGHFSPIQQVKIRITDFLKPE